MNGKLIVVVGLPGSGKTTLLNRFKQEGKITDFADDYQANPQHLKKPAESMYYQKLVNGLRKGQVWAITDIRYCKRGERQILARTLRQAVPGLKIQYIFFENRPDICKSNVIKRNSKSAGIQKKLIDELTQIYKLSKNGKVLSVFKA
jgi:predicted kinase